MMLNNALTHDFELKCRLELFSVELRLATVHAPVLRPQAAENEVEAAAISTLLHVDPENAKTGR